MAVLVDPGEYLLDLLVMFNGVGVGRWVFQKPEVFTPMRLLHK